jgi:N-acetylglucosamine-6-phosphate deacetylase
MLIRGRDPFSHGVYEIDYENGQIQQCTLQKRIRGEVDAYLSVPFFDIQINGAQGISFNSHQLDEAQIHQVVEITTAHGIGLFLPTLITASFEDLAHGFRTLARACRHSSTLAARIAGYHLEGPYISPEEGPRGAHPLAHTRSPNWEEFQRWQDCADGKIRMITLAPELPNALPFIERATQSGVVVAIGHTAANAEQIQAAIQAGAKTSTHLGNGSHAVLPRHPNYIWEQLAADELYASIIPDGFHLPPSVIKTIIRTKGASRTILTCDASSLAGLPSGRYSQWGGEFEILPNGKIVVSGTPYLAGSSFFTDQCVNYLVTTLGYSLAEILPMVTRNPYELFGWPVPQIETGYRGPLLLLKPSNDGLMIDWVN